MDYIKMNLKKILLSMSLSLFSMSIFADTTLVSINYTANNIPFSTGQLACDKMNLLVPLAGGSFTTYVSPNTCLQFVPGASIPYTALSIGTQISCPAGGTIAWNGSIFTSTCINVPACAPLTRNITTGKCEISPKSNGGSICPNNIDHGNPINAGSGNKWQHETDLTGGAFGLTFDRYYNASTTANSSNIGAGWSHAYTRNSTVLSTGTWVTIRRNDGKEYNFQLSAGLWVTDVDVPDRLEELKDSANVRTGWRYTTADNSVETYTAIGKLVSIADHSGLTQTLVYSNASTPVAIAPTAGLLLRVTDSFGRQLNFTYDSSSRISTLTDPSGGVHRYAYDASNNLVSVTYPDGASKTYHYENTAFPHALTGVTDENGNRFATYTYDAQGRATSTEHAGGAERVSLAYNADGTTTVTDALNTSRTYNFQTILGVVKSKGQSQPGGSGCGASASALSYDANGNVASRTDFNGNRTNYSYDLTRNLETSHTEGLTTAGATTPATRTITTAWHPTFRLPVQITNANQQTTYAYNSQGDITQKTVTDTAANTTRSWNTTCTYSTIPGVLLQKVEDGPRTDVSDLTTYDYYPADAACQGGFLGCRGQLMQITDALGHITQLTRYSANGQLEQLTDPNDLVMKMTYDTRQRLTSLDAGGETTIYAYDPAGQLTRVTRPDGAYLAYTYDPAHRLIKTQDNLGNTLTYTLDAMGNRTKEEAHDPGGQLARSQSRVYDALSRLQSLTLPQ
jgi:YD repeat-containing protein